MPRRQGFRRTATTFLTTAALAVGLGAGLGVAPAHAAPPPGGTLPATNVLPPPGQLCPTGSTYLRTLAVFTFDSPEDSTYVPGGWALTTVGDAPSGTHVMRSVLSSNGAGDELHFHIPASAGARTYATAQVRGDVRAWTYGLVTENTWFASWSGPALTSSTSWQRMVVDMTTSPYTQDPSSGLNLMFQNHLYINGPTDPQTSTVEMDDLAVYQCTATASGVRGDFDGDGLADVVVTRRPTDADTRLIVYTPDPSGNHHFYPGPGWTAMDWLGSPGDVTGDGRADLMARRRSDGAMLLYPGNGLGGFLAGRVVGTGWNIMDGITPVGDVNGDGRVDVYARHKATGDLRLYSFYPGGTGMYGGTRVGTGWGGFTKFLQVGDTSGDGRTDLVVIAPNGDMLSYETSAWGGFTGRRTTIGTGWLFTTVTSSGDRTGDGKPDVLAVTAGGDWYVYPTAGGGRWQGRQNFSWPAGIPWSTYGLVL